MWTRTWELTSRGVVVPARNYQSVSCNDIRELSDNKYKTDPYTSQHATPLFYVACPTVIRARGLSDGTI